MVEGSSLMVLVRMLLSLGAVLALIYGLAWAAKRYLKPERFARGGSFASIQVKQSFSLDPKKRLMIVEVEGRKMLLGLAETSISFLADLDADKEKTSEPRSIAS